MTVKLSALDGWIDVCRIGTWIDSKNQTVTITAADFDAMIVDFGTADPIPVVVGHPDIAAPAYAWVAGLRRTGDRLQAKFRDIAPAFRTAVEEGRYTGRSIAAKAGKLRHIGFLGGRAPAVPGLAPTQFSSADIDFDVVLAESDMPTRPALRQLARIFSEFLGDMRDRIIADEGVEVADATLPKWSVRNALRISDRLDGPEPDVRMSEQLPPQLQEDPPVTGNPDETALDATRLAALAADLDAREAALKKNEADQLAAARLADCDRALADHVSVGRILPAERGAIAALMASLSDVEIAFASADDPKKQVTQKPIDTLNALLAAIPKRVEFDEVSGGKMPEKASVVSADFATPDPGQPVDEERLAVHKKVTALASSRNITYREAVVLYAGGLT